MSEWQVFQWGDGSQDGQDKWNIGIADLETSIAFDLPKEVAQAIVDAHNFGAVAQLERLNLEYNRVWDVLRATTPITDIELEYIGFTDVEDWDDG